jgi:hypothetical protein
MTKALFALLLIMGMATAYSCGYSEGQFAGIAMTIPSDQPSNVP